MKKSFCMVLLHFILPVVVCMSQTPIAVSPRIGTVITAEDRAYFGLFPEVDDFKAAWIEGDATSPDRFLIHIQSDEYADEIVELHLRDKLALARFIEEYDSLRFEFYGNGEDFQLPAEILPLVELNLVEEFEYDRGLEVEVAYYGSRPHDAYKGMLLYCDSVRMMIASDTALHAFINPSIEPVTGIRSFKFSPIASANWMERAGYFSVIVATGTFMMGLVGTAMGYLFSGVFQGNENKSNNWNTVAPVAYTFAAIGFLVAAPLSAYFMIVAPSNTIKIGSGQEEYFEILKLFRSLQYYRKGLPPELRNSRER